jgi:hypothetical protein
MADPRQEAVLAHPLRSREAVERELFDARN